MAGIVFIGCIVIAVVAFVVLPEISRRAIRDRAASPDAPVPAMPRGWRGWEDNGEDYDEVFR